MARILVADDQYSVQVWLEHILTQAGHEVVLAYNGRDALEHLGMSVDPSLAVSMSAQAGPAQAASTASSQSVEAASKSSAFDLLITDIVMPEVDGYHLLRWLRQHRVSLPVIVETVRREPTEVDAIKELGARAVLSKPFSKYELLNTLEHVLGQAV
ncbi:MAG: response regulator [Deinococcota bacterium]